MGGCIVAILVFFQPSIKILLVDHYDPKPIGDEIGYSIQIALIKDRVCYTKIISI